MRVGAFSLSRAPSLPVVLASEAAECGLACMAMVARYHGHDVDLSGLRQRYSFSLAGASLRSLIDLADRLNFSSRALRVELSALGKIKLPAIVHWDLNHFVVLREVTRTGVVVHDPGLGVRSLSIEEASKHLTGVVLEIVPASHFQPVTARAPISLSSLWSKLHGVRDGALHVLGLSVALQIVALVAPFQLQLVVDEALFHADRELLTVLALGFGALAVMQAGIEALRNWTIRVLGQMVTFQVAGNLVRHLIRLPQPIHHLPR